MLAGKRSKSRKKTAILAWLVKVPVAVAKANCKKGSNPIPVVIEPGDPFRLRVLTLKELI